jgi:hypothetical protein
VPGESIDVDLLVTDVNGDPFEGATVSIDPYLLGYGSINPTSVQTGADGTALMTYTAPTANLPGQHMLVQLAAAVSHPQHTRVNLAVSQIVVYNDAAPDWILTSIDSVTTTALTPTDPTTTITVVLTDDEGTPIQGEMLDIEYSDASRVSSPVYETPATAVDGTTSFDVTMADTGESGAVRVTIGMMTVANGIHDTVTLTYADPADVLGTDYYGGYIQYDLTKFVEAWGSIHVTAYVFDQNGDPADGVNASVIIPAASAGQMMEWDFYEFNPLWEWVGATLETSVDGQNLPAAGACATPMDGAQNLEYFDFWYGYAPVGVTLTGGVYEMDLYGGDVASLDLITDIFVMPGSWCTAPFDGDEPIGSRDDWGPWPLGYYFWGPSLISSSLGYGRAYEVATVTYSIDTPVLMAEDGVPDTTGVQVWVWDENNDPIENADVRIYEGTSSGGSLQNNNYRVDPCAGRATLSVPSDVDGMSEFEVTTVVWDAASASYTGGLTAIVNPSMFIRARVPGIALPVISQTQLVVEPTRDVAYIVPEPVTVVKPVGDYVTVTAQAFGADGEPYANLPVSIGVNLGTITTPNTWTDSSGMATLGVDTSGIAGATAAFLAVSLITSGAPEGASCRIMVALMNEAPSIEITGPAADAEVERPDATITGGIFDANGIAEATLKVDDGTPIDLVVTEGSIAIAISEVLADLEEGEHTVTISATDSLGVSSEADVTFTMVKGGDGADMLAWGLAIAAWVIVAVLLVFMYLKMWKPKSGEPVEPAMAESEVAEPEPEEPK